jgi:hypothetical protein
MRRFENREMVHGFGEAEKQTTDDQRHCHSMDPRSQRGSSNKQKKPCFQVSSVSRSSLTHLRFLVLKFSIQKMNIRLSSETESKGRFCEDCVAKGMVLDDQKQTCLCTKNAAIIVAGNSKKGR